MIPDHGIIIVDTGIVTMVTQETTHKFPLEMADLIIDMRKIIINIIEKQIKREQNIIKKCTKKIDITADTDSVLSI